MIKVALIGIGGMGGCHFECYKNIKNAEVIAVCDIRADMAREKVNNDKIHIYESYDELLMKEHPDYVDICTPSYLHREMSIKAMERGFHVLCEKPMSLSSKDAAAIIAAAQKYNRTFMTAHVVRFMTPYMCLKQIIESKELGELLRLDMKRISEIPAWSWENWMLDLDKSGGTPFDLSIHDIDFAQYVLGEPKEVRGVYYNKLKDRNDYIVSELVYDNCVVSTEAAWYGYSIPFSAEFSAVFTEGTLKYQGGRMFKNEKELEVNTGEVISDTGINISGVDGYGGEIEYFANCIENGTEPGLVTPESSMASVRLVERILKNAVII